MKKFWRGYRKAGHFDEEKIRAQQNARKRFMELVMLGHEAENEFVEAYKLWNPDATPDKMKEVVRQFHACVSERQQRDLPGR
jgi:hypothetical protein